VSEVGDTVHNRGGGAEKRSSSGMWKLASNQRIANGPPTVTSLGKVIEQVRKNGRSSKTPARMNQKRKDPLAQRKGAGNCVGSQHFRIPNYAHLIGNWIRRGKGSGKGCNGPLKKKAVKTNDFKIWGQKPDGEREDSVRKERGEKT